MAAASVGGHLEAILAVGQELKEALLQAAEQLEEAFDQSSLVTRNRLFAHSCPVLNRRMPRPVHVASKSGRVLPKGAPRFATCPILY
jgi:hypothetical protein